MGIPLIVQLLLLVILANADCVDIFDRIQRVIKNRSGASIDMNADLGNTDGVYTGGIFRKIQINKTADPLNKRLILAHEGDHAITDAKINQNPSIENNLWGIFFLARNTELAHFQKSSSMARIINYETRFGIDEILRWNKDARMRTFVGNKLAKDPKQGTRSTREKIQAYQAAKNTQRFVNASNQLLDTTIVEVERALAHGGGGAEVIETSFRPFRKALDVKLKINGTDNKSLEVYIPIASREGEGETISAQAALERVLVVLKAAKSKLGELKPYEPKLDL